MYYLVATIYVLVCLVLMLVILLQQGKGGDIANAFGGGGSQAAFGARSGATVLSRATTDLLPCCSWSARSCWASSASAAEAVRSSAAGAPQQPAPAAPAPAPVAPAQPAPAAPASTDAVASSRSTVLPSCGSGGIGRRTSLRGWRPQGRGGSSPFFRTSLR